MARSIVSGFIDSQCSTDNMQSLKTTFGLKNSFGSPLFETSADMKDYL